MTEELLCYGSELIDGCFGSDTVVGVAGCLVLEADFHSVWSAAE